MPELIAAWDAAALLFIQEHLRTAVGDLILTLWSTVGNGGMIWIAAGVIMLCFRRTRRLGALALGAMLLNAVVVNLGLKPLIARPRPWLVVEGLEPLLYSKDMHSFPSGHTSAAFAFAVAVCLNVKRKWIGAVVVFAAALMGWSRLYVGVHFPSDVIAGALIGAACGVLATWFYRRFLEKRFPMR